MKNLELYYEMLRLRMIEEKIADLYARQDMRCPVHLSTGQEAVAVGVSAVLESHDYALSGHRSHGHYLARGGDLKSMLAELYGKATGCTAGKGGSMHLTDEKAGFLAATPIVGSTIPIAVGVAFGTHMRGENRVTVSYLGDAAVEEGVFHEAINFAVLERLPIVFVCENNLYSVYSPLSVRQPADRRIFEQARGYGLPSFHGDGNDVTEVFRLTKDAVLRARSGQGPTFLEFATYRWREHCGHNFDNDLGYRTVEEYEKWKLCCPVTTFEKRILGTKEASPEEIAEMAKRIELELDQAIAFAHQSPFPAANTAFQKVYAD